MKIETHENKYDSYGIEIINDDKILSVIKTVNSIRISCQKEDYSKINNIEFDIYKDDQELYMIFDKLYTNLLSANTVGNNDINNYVHEQIVNEDKVKVISDTYPAICPNILEISKDEEKISLNFEKVNGIKYGQIKMPHDIPIHIRKSNSRISDFSILFDVMFKELQDIEKKDFVRTR